MDIPESIIGELMLSLIETVDEQNKSSYSRLYFRKLILDFEYWLSEERSDCSDYEEYIEAMVNATNYMKGRMNQVSSHYYNKPFFPDYENEKLNPNASVEIEIGEELGRFESKAQWINTAQRVYQQAYKKIKGRDVITLDSATPRRVMLSGLQFEQAEKDFTYPAVIYAIKAT